MTFFVQLFTMLSFTVFIFYVLLAAHFWQLLSCYSIAWSCKLFRFNPDSCMLYILDIYSSNLIFDWYLLAVIAFAGRFSSCFEASGHEPGYLAIWFPSYLVIWRQVVVIFKIIRLAVGRQTKYVNNTQRVAMARSKCCKVLKLIPEEWLTRLLNHFEY